MNIKIKTGADSEGLKRETMFIDGKERLHVQALCDCPEDAIIGRNLVSCSQVSRYMREAYEAGKAGQEFNVTFSVADDD